MYVCMYEPMYVWMYGLYVMYVLYDLYVIYVCMYVRMYVYILIYLFIVEEKYHYTKICTYINVPI
jgi:hypothetical protein